MITYITHVPSWPSPYIYNKHCIVPAALHVGGGPSLHSHCLLLLLHRLWWLLGFRQWSGQQCHAISGQTFLAGWSCQPAGGDPRVWQLPGEFCTNAAADITKLRYAVHQLVCHYVLLPAAPAMLCYALLELFSMLCLCVLQLI